MQPRSRRVHRRQLPGVISDLPLASNCLSSAMDPEYADIDVGIEQVERFQKHF